MGHATQPQPQQPTPADMARQPNRILNTPDTVAQCATELRTPGETIAAAADAAAQRGSITPGRTL